MSAVDQNIPELASPLPSEYQQPISLRMLRETVLQQQTLIDILKKQIEKLHNQAQQSEKIRLQLQKSYNAALQVIETQKQKIQVLTENNQSFIHTLQVFQREFVGKDYKNGINISADGEKGRTHSDGTFFLELIRNMRQKFGDEVNEPKEQKKTQLNEYYGYFFNEEIQDRQLQFFNEIKQKKNTIGSTALKTKIKNFGRKHYFNQQYRYWFWFNMLDRPLKITRSFYAWLSEKYQINKQTKIVQSVSLIDRDLNRMDLKIEDSKQKAMKNAIRKCLQIFQIYRPDVGYIQGMSYLAWMFLIRLTDYEAFSSFSNLILSDPFVSSLYFFKEDKIKKIKQFYEKCMEDKKPKLLKHMKNLEVECQFFIIEWAYTMFSRAFTLRISSKIWDLWLSEGFNVFYRVVIVIMDMLETQILQIHQNDKIIEFIRNHTHGLDEKQFLRSLRRQKLSEQLQF